MESNSVNNFFKEDLPRKIPAKFGPEVWSEKMFKEIVDNAGRTQGQTESYP